MPERESRQSLLQRASARLASVTGPARDELAAAIDALTADAPAFDEILLARDAYRDQSKVDTHERVRVIEQRSDLYAALYRDRADARAYTLAFRGSDGARDWLTANVQSIVGRAPQYREAIELVDALRGELDGPLRLTGHSLGGGLAAYAAVAFGLTATTYNAPGVHDKLLAAVERTRDHAATLIRNYYVRGELVTTAQGRRERLPTALGVQIECPALDDDGAPVDDPRPPDAAKLHHINASCRGLTALEQLRVDALAAALARAETS
ncbi:MAG: DUF2974 domain-containing protein [Myxococcales bacterium]|nr:DUF2974 domain-containing protein [Myxococcales bacterium]